MRPGTACRKALEQRRIMAGEVRDIGWIAF